MKKLVDYTEMRLARLTKTCCAVKKRHSLYSRLSRKKGNQSRILRVAKKDYFIDGTALPEVSE